jgi:hypothetical protein
MQIKVLVNTIDYEPVLEYYNYNKSDDEEPLEILNRAEGGFKIAIPKMKNKYVDENLKIRQLRWSMGNLLSMEYIGFTEKQTMLLYESLLYTLKGNVLLIGNNI